MKHISSSQNAIVKKIVDLKSKASARRSEKLCVIEGFKEIEIAIESNVNIRTLLVNEKEFKIDSTKFEAFLNCTNDILICSDEVMDKIALRDSKQKIIAIADTIELELSEIKLSPSPFVLILENIEKPGNLGALLRTCDAAGVDAILCTSMQTDIYNPNVIRNSLGCVFSQKIVSCSNEEALNFCIIHKINIYSTYLHTDYNYYQKDFTLPTAIVMGSEGFGITDFWLNDTVELIKIPMLGKIDSMNVSNSASILLFDVVRQRIINI